MNLINNTPSNTISNTISNSINSTISNTINSNINHITDWAANTPINEMFDSLTYDIYESDNPFRHEYSKSEIKNPAVKYTINAAKTTGAELYSVFANPFYLAHKIVNIPVYYKNAADLYKKASSNLCSNKD